MQADLELNTSIIRRMFYFVDIPLIVRGYGVCRTRYHIMCVLFTLNQGCVLPVPLRERFANPFVPARSTRTLVILSDMFLRFIGFVNIPE